MKDAAKYLEDACGQHAANEELSELFTQLRDLHARRLWHQATAVLAKLVNRPELKTGGQLQRLYTEAIEDFESKCVERNKSFLLIIFYRL